MKYTLSPRLAINCRKSQVPNAEEYSPYDGSSKFLLRGRGLDWVADEVS